MLWIELNKTRMRRKNNPPRLLLCLGHTRMGKREGTVDPTKPTTLTRNENYQDRAAEEEAAKRLRGQDAAPSKALVLKIKFLATRSV